MLTEENYYNLLNSRETLYEDELRDLVNSFEIETTYGENRRWSRGALTIIQLKDKYYAVEWDEGLTELQPDEFYSQPYEVEPYEHEKIITVKEWRRKNESDTL